LPSSAEGGKRRKREGERKENESRCVLEPIDVALTFSACAKEMGRERKKGGERGEIVSSDSLCPKLL